MAAGVMLLETLEGAHARGQEPIAEILGFGASGDAFHISQPAPHGSGAALAMERALRDAKISPAHVVHVNAHASSTAVGDRTELQALQQVCRPAFVQNSNFCNQDDGQQE